MKISIVEETFDQIKKAGVPTGGGAVTQAVLKQPMVTAEFPSQRAAGIDNAYNASSLYNNGLLFTAYDYTNGSKESLRSLRSAAQNPTQLFSLGTGNIKSKQILATKEFGMLQPLCQILLPRSVNDNEVNSHRYQDATDGLMSKGASRVVSNVIWGAIETVSGGILADRREAIDVGTKSAFQGSDKRTRMYYNTFVIENRNDLMELIKIYYLFTILGYGTTGGGTPAEVASVGKRIAEEYLSKATNFLAPKSNQSRPEDFKNSVTNDVIDFITNVEIIKSPPVWFIRDFQTGDSLRLPHSTFGPAGISSVRFGRSIDNIVNTLRESPNTPIALEIEIQFVELIDMRQDSIFDNF